MGVLALWLLGAGWAGAEVVFQSLSPGAAPPQWIQDLNQLSEEERRRRVENYRTPEPVQPARVAAAVMKREEPAIPAPAPGPVVIPNPGQGELARVRPVPVSELQLAAPVPRAAPAAVAPAVVAPVMSEPAPDQVVEPSVERRVEPESRPSPEEETARRFRWRNVFGRSGSESSTEIAPQREAVKQRPPAPVNPASPQKALRKSRSDRSVAEEKEASRPPSEAQTGKYRIRLSGAQRDVDIPVDDRIPKPTKAEQQRAAADDAADYSGEKRTGFGRRKDRAGGAGLEKEEAALAEAKEKAAAEKPRSRRGLFGLGQRRGKGGLASGGGVIETTLFGE
ncbi:MAG TPA: hypothetical protein VMN36_07855 [Verrucomicrobiales bacterium]|nr:hypothetical protein [Verrucomicrobiales bacterium]